MLRELLNLYEDCRVNRGRPECLFAETLLFNEGWMLRALLRAWKSARRPSRFGFLPFPDGVTIYSEAQLYTPFKARARGDKQAEAHTHVDGIVGDFGLAAKSGVVLDPDWRYLAVFEAKMYSPLSKRIRHAPHYDQVSRTVACMVNAILKTGEQDRTASLVVLYARGNRRIDPGCYTRAHLEDQIGRRIEGYLGPGSPVAEEAPFFREWRRVLDRIQLYFLTWEDVLAEIDCDDLHRFYDLCKRFNQGAVA